MRLRVLVPALLAVAAAAGCQSSTGGSGAAAPTSPAEVHQAAAATTTAAAPVTTTKAAPDTVTVPSLSGKRLSDAEAALYGIGLVDEPMDGSGQGRMVIDPTNWVVRSQRPAAGAKVEEGATVTLTVTKPSDGAGSQQTSAGVVPDVVCKNLQEAQDTLQAAGYYLLGSQDATGRGRMQILDRDWVVVKQSVAAGTKASLTTRVVLSSVKFGESTGSSGCAS